MSHRNDPEFLAAVQAHPILTGIDEAGRYTGEYSDDDGRTWQPLPARNGEDTVCGGHVQVEIAVALTSHGDSSGDGVITADGGTITVRGRRQRSRWTIAGGR